MLLQLLRACWHRASCSPGITQQLGHVQPPICECGIAERKLFPPLILFPKTLLQCLSHVWPSWMSRVPECVLSADPKSCPCRSVLFWKDHGASPAVLAGTGLACGHSPRRPQVCQGRDQLSLFWRLSTRFTASNCWKPPDEPQQ